MLEVQGRRIEAAFPNETQDDLVSDFVSILTSMAALIYGRRGSRRKAERIKQCVEAGGLMTEFRNEQALVNSLEWRESRHADIERRIARGDYEFFSSVDIELRELEQEAQRNGFVLECNWDGQDFVYTIEQLSPEDYAAFLAEEEAVMLEGLKWKYSKGFLPS